MSAPPLQRVLMTADSVGGVWNYALQLCEELARHDIEVTLVVMGGKPSIEQMREADGLSNLRLIGSNLKLEWMPGAAPDLKLADALLLELEAEHKPDIVHINGFANAAAGFRAPVVVAAHSCVSSWWQACWREPPPGEWQGYERRIKEGIAAADAVVAPSRSFLRTFVEIHGEPKLSRVVLNGRDPDRYRPAAKRRMVLAAGRVWDRAKNIEALCKAAERISYPLLVAGDQAPLRDMPANVIPLGRIGADALAGRMAEAAVFAAPARYEPFGLAILEAALAGCALVLGDIATLRELWGGAADFVDPDDVVGIGDALERLLADPRRAAEAGERARRRALSYSAERMARGYLELYGELLERAAPRASYGVGMGEAACA